MRLALNMGYAGTAVEPRLEFVQEADRLGYHSVWVAEAYGSDAVSMLAWYGASTPRIGLGSAIMQMPARTPAMTAMTAATLSELSGGRFLLGLGMSGPQVVEGWHGRPYGKPLRVTREYVEIVRRILSREARLRFEGEYHRIPYDGPDATGLGKTLRLTIHPRHEIPIYLAAIGPKNVALAAEIADGWLPFWYSPFRGAEVFEPALAAGFAASGEPDKRKRFDILPTVPAVVTDDVDQARWGVRPLLALYVGGMGARGQNFYTRLAERYGFEAEAAEIQDLYLEGKKGEAAQAVPDALVDEIALVGDRARIADRLAAWRECGVTTLILQARQPEALQLLAELIL